MLGIIELCWGDVGLLLSMPRQGLGNSAIASVASDEQLERYGGKWAAMAITEPEAGSDSAAIRTTADLDGDEYVLNGEKIFVTSGDRADLIVVWATLDRKVGRAAIRSFIVERDNPGLKLDRLEHKLGIRASDTANFTLQDCRVPKEALLGDPEVKSDPKQGFGGAMQTFDNTRPLVAAMAVGVARASLEETRKRLEEAGVEIDYDTPALSPVRRGGPLPRNGVRLRGGAPAHPAGGLDGRQRQAELAAGLDGEGEGGAHLRRRCARLRRALWVGWVRRERVAREVGAGREDPRHLRGDAADSVVDRGSAVAGEELQRTAVALGEPDPLPLRPLRSRSRREVRAWSLSLIGRGTGSPSTSSSPTAPNAAGQALTSWPPRADWRAVNFIEDVMERSPASRLGIVAVDAEGNRRDWYFGELIARRRGSRGRLLLGG